MCAVVGVGVCGADAGRDDRACEFGGGPFVAPQLVRAKTVSAEHHTRAQRGVGFIRWVLILLADNLGKGHGLIGALFGGEDRSKHRRPDKTPIAVRATTSRDFAYRGPPTHRYGFDFQTFGDFFAGQDLP